MYNSWEYGGETRVVRYVQWDTAGQVIGKIWYVMGQIQCVMDKSNFVAPVISLKGVSR